MTNAIFTLEDTFVFGQINKTHYFVTLSLNDEFFIKYNVLFYQANAQYYLSFLCFQINQMTYTCTQASCRYLLKIQFRLRILKNVKKI